MLEMLTKEPSSSKYGPQGTRPKVAKPTLNIMIGSLSSPRRAMPVQKQERREQVIVRALSSL